MALRRIPSGGPFEARIGYCRAVVTDDGWVHVAGTCARPGPDGTLPKGAAAQCESALQVIGEALAEAGAGFADVVRVRYYLPDRRAFEECWPALRAAFGDNPPAATMLECGLIDPAYLIEIEVTARIAPGL